MKVSYTFNFRKFGPEERTDSGYYNGLGSRNRAVIDVNRHDDTFEQVLTVYHEMTHAVLDLLAIYKIDKKYKKIEPDQTGLKKAWAEADPDSKLEERICRAVEYAVKQAFRKEMPAKFYKRFFDQGKRPELKKKQVKKTR